MAIDDDSSPNIHVIPPQIVTILQPSRSHREVVSGPRKNIMPVAREPTHADMLEIKKRKKEREKKFVTKTVIVDIMLGDEGKVNIDNSFRAVFK